MVKYWIKFLDGPIKTSNIGNTHFVGITHRPILGTKPYMFFEARKNRYVQYKFSKRIGDTFWMTFTGQTKPHKYWKK